MDKQKQIEEMAKTLCENCRKDGYSCSLYSRDDDWVCLQERERAETFYNAGYRKIPEGAVVLTEEKAVKAYKMREMLDNLGVFAILEYERKEARKETAEKFAERLKDEVLNFCGTVEENGYFERGKLCFCEDIDEICKEITEDNV